MARNSFIHDLDRYVNWLDDTKPKHINRSIARIAVTEKYARRKLRIKKKDPLVYKGLTLICVGSHAWNMERQNAKGKMGQ